MADLNKIDLNARFLANAMDSRDAGGKDGKIEASVWNKFIDSIKAEKRTAQVGSRIQRCITVENAINAIKRYAAAAETLMQQAAENIIDTWSAKQNPENEAAPEQATVPETPKGEALSGKGYLVPFGGAQPVKSSDGIVTSLNIKKPDNATENKELTYNPEDGTYTLVNDDETTTVYDNAGFVREIRNKDGKPTRVFNYVEHKPTTESGKSYTTLDSYTDIEYDKDGNELKRSTFTYFGKAKEVQIQNSKDNSVTTVKYGASTQEILSLTKDILDGSGRPVRKYEYNADGTVDHYLEYVYNGEELSQVVRRDKDGNVEYYYSKAEVEEESAELFKIVSPRGIAGSEKVKIDE